MPKASGGRSSGTFDKNMTREFIHPLIVKCGACKEANLFNQPYPYHAGFGNQGFLYNKSGNATLTWSSFDPDYMAIVGSKHPWALTQEEKTKIEDALLPSPDGTPWGFDFPARCAHCNSPLAEPMTKQISYYVFDTHVDVDLDAKPSVTLGSVMKNMVERAGAVNPHACGTFGTSAAEQPLVPKASGDT
jgi:phage FluMu protein Com